MRLFFSIGCAPDAAPTTETASPAVAEPPTAPVSGTAMPIRWGMCGDPDFGGDSEAALARAPVGRSKGETSERAEFSVPGRLGAALMSRAGVDPAELVSEPSIEVALR